MSALSKLTGISVIGAESVITTEHLYIHVCHKRMSAEYYIDNVL